MIVILGGAGYVGQAIVRALKRRGIKHKTLSRLKVDYTNEGVEKLDI